MRYRATPPKRSSLVNPEEEIEKVSEIFLNLERKASKRFMARQLIKRAEQRAEKERVQGGRVAKAPGSLRFRAQGRLKPSDEPILREIRPETKKAFLKKSLTEAQKTAF